MPRHDDPPLDDAADPADEPDHALDDALDHALDTEFERFFVDHYDEVLAGLVAVLRDHDVAVDAAQDGFIKAHRHWQQVRTYDAPAAWVRRTAINASRDRLRSDRRRRERESTVVGDPTTHSDPGPSPGASALLADLPARQRQVATRFYVDDLSVEQIAEELGLSTGTVKSHLADARARLRRHLQR